MSVHLRSSINIITIEREPPKAIFHILIHFAVAGSFLGIVPIGLTSPDRVLVGGGFLDITRPGFTNPVCVTLRRKAIRKRHTPPLHRNRIVRCLLRVQQAR